MSPRLASLILLAGLGCGGPEAEPISASTAAAREIAPAEFKSALVRRLSRSGATMQAEPLPRGGTLLRTGEGAYHVTVASRDASGRTSRVCLGSRREVEAMMPERAP